MPAEATLGEVARAAIASGVDRLLGNEALLSESAVEAVHQMRVATRRLRSDLRTFGPALDRRWARKLREELGWIADVLGAARDADVLSERLSDRAGQLAPEHVDGAAQALAALAEQRARARCALRDALASERHDALLERLRAAAASPALRSAEKTDRPAGETLPAIVQRAWRGLEKEVASLLQSPSDDQLHRVRIAAKRCRYAAEACAPILGNGTTQLARGCKQLQTVLGELGDAVVTERWLRAWAAHAPTRTGGAAADELAALERAAARKARARWPRAWEHVLARVPATGRPPSR